MKVHIGPYRKNRRVDIRIDAYDTWNMDSTLALIVLPMLKQLKATKHGSPHVDNSDVPEFLRGFDRYEFYGYNYQQQDLFLTNDELQSLHDEYIHAKWDWVMDEMIWAFEQLNDDDDESQFFDHSECGENESIQESASKMKVDWDGLKAHQERKANGFRLFGKYYQGLWD
jgi:hypothetical protein